MAGEIRDQLLARIRSGIGLTNAPPQNEFDREIDEALRIGLERYYEHILLPEGTTQYMIVERTEFAYDKGIRKESGSVSGALTEVFGGDPLRSNGLHASFFCERTILLPTESNAVQVAVPRAGVLELVLRLR